jgi:hypothetical protein
MAAVDLPFIHLTLAQAVTQRESDACDVASVDRVVTLSETICLRRNPKSGKDIAPDF